MAIRRILNCFKRDKMTKEEYETIMKQIRFNRQMQKKRLYEQAKKANKKAKKGLDKS